MKSLLFASSCCYLSLLVLATRPDDRRNESSEKLQAQETIGHYGGLGHGLDSLHALKPALHSLTPSLHSLTPSTLYTPTSGGLSSGSYDDLHKYGGIGKKSSLSSLYDHGSKGYKDYYDDGAYANQGLNKYANEYKTDKYGGKSGKHADYHGGHVYTRNRGYGYEKHYMYDKEYSTSKHGGSKGGHQSYYGDHKKGGKSSVQAYKNYGHKKYGAKNGHDDHAYGKFGHLLADHGEHYLKHKGGHHKIVEHHVEPETYVTHHVPDTYVTQQHEYVPVQVVDNYGGALGHGLSTPTYADHSVSDHGMLEYDSPHTLHSSHPNVMYVSSASNNAGTVEPESGGPVLTLSKAPAETPLPATNSAVISTKVVAPPPTPPVYATIGDTMRVNSAVHATPAVISTRPGAHYYNS